MTVHDPAGPQPDPVEPPPVVPGVPDPATPILPDHNPGVPDPEVTADGA
jgi:hypothetical protein